MAPPSPAAATVSEPAEKDLRGDVQSLSLRVLCLSKPSFRLGFPMVNEPREVAESLALTHAGDYSEGWEFGLGDFMLLPSTVPTIYLGQTFSVYLSIHNHSMFDVASVSIKAELQLQGVKSPRIALLDVPPTQIPAFPANDSNDFILQHVMQVEGVYMLACSVSYVRHDGEKKQFRKFFRFPVENPLALRTKVHSLGAMLLVESQITNSTKEPLFINDACVLVNAEGGACRSLKPLPFERAEETAFSGFYLKSSHCIQLLFELDKQALAPLPPSDSIGYLQVEWRTALGDLGRVNSEPLRPKMSPKAGIHVYFSDVPPHTFLEEPFSVTCVVTNQSPSSDVSLTMYLIHQKMTGVVISGISGLALGRLSPAQTKSFKLTMYPLKPGVQKITGLRFVDTLCDKRYDFDNILQIYVGIRPSSSTPSIIPSSSTTIATMPTSSSSSSSSPSFPAPL